MQTKMLLIVVAVVALVIGIVVGVVVAPFILFRGHTMSPGFQSPGSIANTKGALLSGTQYYSYAYQISGNATLSSSGKIATSDFNITEKTLQNGSTTYSIAFSELGTVYNVTISPTEKLYFIDTNLQDDVHGSDLSLGDDGFAVVNATGYVVEVEYPLPNT